MSYVHLLKAKAKWNGCTPMLLQHKVRKTKPTNHFVCRSVVVLQKNIGYFVGVLSINRCNSGLVNIGLCRLGFLAQEHCPKNEHENMELTMEQILIEVIIKFNEKYNKLTPSSVSSCSVKFNYLRESNEYKPKWIHII